METPLYSALCALSEQGGLRMHMPGHKGKAMTPLFSAAAIDYTEIDPTGNLYTGEGPIAEAERLAARAFGVKDAYFLTGGSTQGVMAGLALCVPEGGTVLLDRNTHRSFFNAAGLLDLTPVYLRTLGPEAADAALEAHPEVSALCITSPTYYGVVADIPAFAAVCRARGVRLLVDEAHGAHFPFVGRGPCAAGQGASVSISSAHKTLPALGSSALLFTDGSFSPEEVREKTALFGTSSPSYTILASIDWARAYLEEGEGGALYRRTAQATAELRRHINRRGVFHALSEEDGLTLDPTRLTVQTAPAGLSGHKAGAILEAEFGIYPEMASADAVVCILTCCDSPEDLARLSAALDALADRFEGGTPLPACGAPPVPESCCSLRRALFAKKEQLPLCRAVGRISAVSVAPYPPGVPVIAPGERIDPAVLHYLEAIGYDTKAPVGVLKEELPHVQ